MDIRSLFLISINAHVEVAALGVLTIYRGCFERCCSNKKTPPYPVDLGFATLRTLRPTLLRASAYRTPFEAHSRRRCGHASRFLWLNLYEEVDPRQIDRSIDRDRNICLEIDKDICTCPRPERAPSSWCLRQSRVSVTRGGPGAGTTSGATGLT